MKKIFFLPTIFFQAIIRLVARIIFSVFFDFKVEGIERIKKSSAPLIFAPNHASEWDGPLMPVPIKFTPMIYVGMSKEGYAAKDFGLRSLIYGGCLFRMIGIYPAPYGLNDYKESLKTHIDFLQRGFCVTIFPEGKRSKDGIINDFKSGVIALAHETQAKVVPVYIKDTHRLGMKTFLRRERKVRVVFGEPYYVHIDKNKKGEELIRSYKKEALNLRDKVANLSHD